MSTITEVISTCINTLNSNSLSNSLKKETKPLDALHFYNLTAEEKADVFALQKILSEFEQSQQKAKMELMILLMNVK
jgi:exonuclease III